VDCRLLESNDLERKQHRWCNVKTWGEELEGKACPGIWESFGIEFVIVMQEGNCDYAAHSALMTRRTLGVAIAGFSFSSELDPINSDYFANRNYLKRGQRRK
jgi:hypothetical protein